jgi:hypothetical protein
MLLGPAFSLREVVGVNLDAQASRTKPFRHDLFAEAAIEKENQVIMLRAGQSRTAMLR